MTVSASSCAGGEDGRRTGARHEATDRRPRARVRQVLFARWMLPPRPVVSRVRRDVDYALPIPGPRADALEPHPGDRSWLREACPTKLTRVVEVSVCPPRSKK